MKQVIITLLTLIASTTVFCYCPIDKIYGIEKCSYRIECIETVKDIKLKDECTGAANFDIKIDVTLRNATDSFHLKADTDFLSMITTLRMFGNWPRTDLPFLDSMPRLRTVYLSYSNMQKINDSPFRNLINLESIDLSHNQLSEIEELFQFDIRPFKMRKLSLAFNLIEEVPGYTFEALTSLQELDLSHNLIRELNEEPFCNLTNLVSLRLNNNNIVYLNGAMNNLTNLLHLYLRYNQIQDIDMDSLKTINHLQTFDISNNKIKILQPIMLSRHWDHFNNQSICRIILSDNEIHVLHNATDFHDRFKKKLLKNEVQLITQLDISKNSISHIDYSAFHSIGRLDSLDLSNNKLLSFNVNSEDLMYVRYLNLSCNSLSILYYESFSLMHNLQNLDLSHNSMDYFPDQSLSNSYKLKNVNVTYNYIEEIHNLRITFHPEGGVLDLSNNGLSALNIPVDEAFGLSDLILSSNNITDAYLIRLIDQRDLVRLDMSKNFIQELDESSLQLTNTIIYLDLSFNDIQVIGPSAFHRVNNLKTLRLSHNRIKTVEYGVFRGLTELLNLDLSYNQIEMLDSKVFMDLKFLSVLSLRHNGLNFIDRDSWLTHKHDIKVFLDGNQLSCDWLAKALLDYNNGYSKMYPTVLVSTVSGHSIEGIPCVQDVGFLTNPQSKYMIDERLLITTQKILKAVQDQTSFLSKFILRSYRQEAESRQNRAF
ncbi:leucine-rich repeat-containing protein 15-like [Nymphalis io]|uniref:leucine-rich repeat-containing protein 15-like n=1 Tax=Inachis io TaxID=171585 RepID=UPI00216AA01A|nr:leucine-rich repeat-containing protein 15-like [Nymphalis io]